jgi:hypothetical protein
LQDSEDKEKTYDDRGKKRIDLVKMKEGEQEKKEFYETCGCIKIHCSQA